MTQLSAEYKPHFSFLVMIINSRQCNISLEPDLLKGYTANIRAAVWSNDGKFVYSGGEDKAMRYVAA